MNKNTSNSLYILYNNSIYCLTLVFLFSFSFCHSQTNIEKENALILKEAIILFYKSGDTSKLNEAYQILSKEKSYNECIINPHYLQNGITVLSLLKKYEELDCVLKNEKNKIEHDFREDLIDFNEYMQYKTTDSVRAIMALNRTVTRLEQKLQSNPADSIIEQKLFLAKVYTIGKKKVIQEIDSVIKSNTMKNSHNFYETLKYTINKLPLEDGENMNEVNKNGNMTYPKPEINK